MDSTTTIYFVRHGHVRNLSDVHYGRLLGFPLSEEGRCQASIARDKLRDKPIAALYTSPQLRARETAQIILGAHKDLILSISDLLDEAYSPFDGRPRHELEERNWDLYSGTDSKYEKPEDVFKRVKQFVSEVCLGHVEQQIIAVTHADTIAFCMLWIQELPYSPEKKQQLYTDFLAPGSVTTFVFRVAREGDLSRIECVKLLEDNS